MATGTLGTNANNSLVSLPWTSNMTPADVATIAQGIKGQNAAQAVVPGAFVQAGLLFLPGHRGVIKLQAGDYVALDATSGWPIVVSTYALANGPWTHT